MSLEENLRNRGLLVRALRSAVIGPDYPTEKLETLPTSLTKDQARRVLPSAQSDGEEILTRDTPTARYGAGILFPPRAMTDSDTEIADLEVDVGDVDLPPGDQRLSPSTPQAQAAARNRSFEADGDDLAISATNSYMPSAIALSMVVDVEQIGHGIIVEVGNTVRTTPTAVEFNDSGYYKRHVIKVGREEGNEAVDRRWWLRRPLRTEASRPQVVLGPAEVLKSGRERLSIEGFPGTLEVRWTVRPWKQDENRGARLLTISLQNVTPVAGNSERDTHSLFQAGIVVHLPVTAALRYPPALLRTKDQLDPLSDERVNRLLYANRPVFAVGHGCAADWQVNEAGRAIDVWTDAMPSYEIPPVDFDVFHPSRGKLNLSMRSFSSLTEDHLDSLSSLDELVNLYEVWISKLPTNDASKTDAETAGKLWDRCRASASRMRDGLTLLRTDKTTRRAFSLANEAMLMAQHRRQGEARTPHFPNTNEVSWAAGYTQLDLTNQATLALESDLTRPVGQWRPFQLAFLLMSIDGVINDGSVDRGVVDLIWFPTGGGKTEAYLALAAFTVFHNALSGRANADSGETQATTILMRYTLRLLTAQQFQRAVTLFCAMELLREKNRDLGNRRFTVGLWVGRSSTPNSVVRAERQKKLMEGTISSSAGEDPNANSFVLLQCPWCSAAFGRVRELRKTRGRVEYEVHGYQVLGRGHEARFVFRCPDRNCEFGFGRNVQLPALIVDEMIYQTPPTLLIGTVDKFAMLSWRSDARALFGIGDDGSRVARAPSLVIQDELHLMTGPLGTMVGLFETAVDGLCRHDGGVPPKIVASTATAGQADLQVRGLYASTATRVFPAPGVDASDSFFAREDNTKAGRLYVGILAPGYGSMQTSQRHVFAALLQAAADTAMRADEDRAPEVADPWWTLLAYYNSLRELGGALTLFGADIPDQIDVASMRRGLSPQEKRRVRVDGSVMELTSRVSSSDVPEALRSLERPIKTFAKDKAGNRTTWSDFNVQDACLASNIVEVGVDIPRLSLMAIVGQPKTTSAYIQASSRVGRRSDRPGLVVTLYSNTKPRDRSHYERFRSYHQSIYSWIEPASVTPFSAPAIARALHAVMIAIIRQTSPIGDGPQDVFSDAQALLMVREILQKRAEAVGRPDEVKGALTRFDQLRREWGAFNPANWGKAWDPGTPPPALLFPSGTERPASWGRVGWPTPTSLRAVDATCEARVTQYFAEMEADKDDSE